MTNEEVKERMKKLMGPIDEAIMHCDTNEDVLMLSSIMMTTAVGIFREAIGEEAMQEMVKELLSEK